MINRPRNVNNPPQMITPLPLENFTVSWAGQGGREDDFCFGSENGELKFTTIDGVSLGGARLLPAAESPEAINGVAFIGLDFAVSTRNDVKFFTIPDSSSQGQRAIFPCGAHGVIATAEGYFIAPLGQTGLMKVKAGREKEQAITINQIPGRPLDFYKVAALHSQGWPEVLACAVRAGGIAALELAPEGERGQIRSLTFPGLDIVDVCSLGTGVTPPAIAALGRDGTLVLLRDVLRDPSPVTIHFDDLTGAGYRVFSARGSVFVLTSDGLHLLSGLARTFLEEIPMDRVRIPVRKINLDAVDANFCGERWLLVVLPEQVLRFDLEILTESSVAGGIVEEKQEVVPTQLHPTWEIHNDEDADKLVTIS